MRGLALFSELNYALKQQSPAALIVSIAGTLYQFVCDLFLVLLELRFVALDDQGEDRNIQIVAPLGLQIVSEEDG